jgi:hypothetical protein
MVSSATKSCNLAWRTHEQLIRGWCKIASGAKQDAIYKYILMTWW